MVRIVSEQAEINGREYSDFKRHSDVFGAKSAGLSVIPRAWCPPYISVSRDLHDAWLRKDSSFDSTLKTTVDRWLDELRSTAHGGFIVRSSGVEERLADRGQYLSVPIVGESRYADFLSAAFNIFEHNVARNLTSPMGVILQVMLKSESGGHLSNEVRLSPTRNQWLYEVDLPEWISPKGLNSKFAPRPDPNLPLHTSKRFPHQTFRSFGKWVTEAVSTRSHIEWVVARNALWIVQLDLEWREVDSGVDPVEHKDEGSATAPKPDAASAFRAYGLGDETPWKKLRNLADFDFEEAGSAPRLFWATGDELSKALGDDPVAVANEIDSLTAGKAVVRMEVKAGTGPAFNLPRTDTVNGKAACEWLRLQIGDYGVGDGDNMAFILHAFIPAHAGVWAYADPNEPIATLDALWGLPDGLQVLPHDTYQVDATRQVVSSSKVRYKPRFLREMDDGSWQYVDVLRSCSRGSTLRQKDAIEIGVRTANIAKKLGKPVQIMWFSGIPAVYGIGRNLPWFRAREMVEPAPRNAPTYRPFRVSTIAALGALPDTPITIRLDPEAELIRNDEFLDAVIEVALLRRLPVEIQGSTLSHTYYKLFNAGVAVNPPNFSTHYRARGRREFGKLVRDKIPARIKAGGEQVVEARLNREDLPLALLGKLFEEALEYRKARTATESVEELSDLLEVVMSLAGTGEIDWDDIVQQAQKKRESRGSFSERRVLIETSLSRPDGLNKEEAEIRLHEFQYPQTVGVDRLYFPFVSLLTEYVSPELEVSGRVVQISAKAEGSGVVIVLRDLGEPSAPNEQLDLFG